MDNTAIAAIATGVVAPVLGYLKIREDRLKTADKRDAKEALVEKRLSDVESKLVAIEELKTSINNMNITMTKIQTILEIYVKNCDQCTATGNG